MRGLHAVSITFGRGKCSNDGAATNSTTALRVAYGSGSCRGILERGATPCRKSASLCDAHRQGRGGGRGFSPGDTAGGVAQFRPVRNWHQLQSLAVSHSYKFPIQATSPNQPEGRSAVSRRNRHLVASVRISDYVKSHVENTERDSGKTSPT